ncbi:hypothetical protein EON63_12755 [archaeon]|nr:MAG: hypothetical protein EON63_12755 [archaeon]
MLEISLCYTLYFPPFHPNRLQPVLETREKQLKLWRDLILKYCSATHVYRIVPSNFPYFANDTIDRKLSADGIGAVVEFLLQSGKPPHI